MMVLPSRYRIMAILTTIPMDIVMITAVSRRVGLVNWFVIM